ncbi:1-deoxy-D-xylulose-5-phosphate reductoisomerase [Numidum massiliense]|uniref:1-deoxy-D-xylulose-5-phosphate reductoisomerase n=1 Tax=Numidum massiliense TaxID=1522315 RepID=UPI0006D5ABF9|nr:1-deoxy-D-xylulose-5-phosphate reductoisomerase [Numidum massiliense]
MPKSIALLGSTGSIGKNTLNVIAAHPEKFQLSSFAAGKNVALAVEQALKFRPRFVSLATKEGAEEARQALPAEIDVVWGKDGLETVAQDAEADTVVAAVVGSIGLRATLAAIAAGKTVALANKESLVAGGELVMRAARKKGVPIVPIDSEHSAIFQCLNGEKRAQVSRLILTASGGAFRDFDRSELHNVTVEQALAHPNWAMGQKLTVDSATMMNKGLEVLEAYWLFDIPFEQIDVVLHRESIIHSMVEFVDSSVIAQLGTPDMRIPIQYALTYPERLPAPYGERLDLAQMGTLHFIALDFERYPCVKMAYDAGKAGGTMPAVMNAANEVAVDQFLQGNIPFLGIEQIVARVMEAHTPQPVEELEALEEVDARARAAARDIMMNTFA